MNDQTKVRLEIWFEDIEILYDEERLLDEEEALAQTLQSEFGGSGCVRKESLQMPALQVGTKYVELGKSVFGPLHAEVREATYWADDHILELGLSVTLKSESAKRNLIAFLKEPANGWTSVR